MQINRAYKYRIYPTKQQEVLLEKHFGSCRFVFNYFLNRRETAYLENKLTLNYYDLASELTELKHKEEYKWLKEVNSQSLQQALRNLDVAYNNFFKKQNKFPKFKAKKDNKKSFCVQQSIEIKGNKLSIPKFKEGIKIKQHRSFNGKICFATISKTCRNKYFVSIIVEEDYIPKHTNTNNKIGIDVGIKDLVITSNGKKYENLKFLEKNQKKLKYNQKQLSKKVKGSNSRNKQRLVLNKYFEKVNNCRSNYIHKISNQLVSENQVIIAENLNVNGMMKNHHLAKSIASASWSELFRQLKYKAEWNNKTFYQIDRFFPSSKTCNNCGYIKQDLTLDDREWECPTCHTKLDRDINASMNILKQGLNDLLNLGLGTKSKSKQKQVEASLLDESMKPEAHCFS